MNLLVKRVFFAVLALVLLAGAEGCHKKKHGLDEEQILTVEELWAKSQTALKKHRNSTARRYLDQIVLREDSGDLKDPATLAIADSYYDEKGIEALVEAISRYQTFLQFHPTHPEAPKCQYRIGLCHLEMMETPDRDVSPALNAAVAFRNVVENYPESAFAEPAKHKLAGVNDMLAAHEIKAGDFYLKGGQWRAAVARYRQVVDKYPTYWNLPLIHFRLAEALAAEGLVEEAKIHYNLVMSQAPGTRLSKDAQERLDRLGRDAAKESRHKKKDLPNDPLLKPKEKHQSDAPWWKFWKRDHDEKG